MRGAGAAVAVAALASLLAACKPPTIESVGGGGPEEAGGNGAQPDPGQGGQSGVSGKGGQGGANFFRVPDAGPNLVDAARCNRLDVGFEKVIPTVAIVVDRSSSMLEGYGTGTRWAALKSSLIGANGLIQANEQDMRFGLVMFTALPSGSTCPALEPAIGQVSFTLGSHAAISAVYGPALPPTTEKGETPTGETIVAVTTALNQVTEPGLKFILLATDGEPDTCPGVCMGTCPVADRPGWPRDPNCGQDKSISAVQAAFAKGIRTYVIGIGNAVGVEHLQALANAGVGLPVVLGTQANWLTASCGYLPAQLAGMYAMTSPMNAPFYQAMDQAALAAALKAILSAVRSCKFVLKGMVELANAGSGQVILDGRPLVYNDPNGWRMNSPTELEVLGAACTELETKARMLNVSFPCSVYLE